MLHDRCQLPWPLTHRTTHTREFIPLAPFTFFTPQTLTTAKINISFALIDFTIHKPANLEPALGCERKKNNFSLGN
jgi:hypothetical protein